MKKLATIGALCLVVVFLSSTACAQEFSASVGLKGWYNKWENFMVKEGMDAEDRVLLVGPSVKLAYGRFFGGATYLRSISDYEYDYPTYTIEEDETSWWGAHVEAGREDLDILVGLMIHPRFGVFGGYKRITSPDGRDISRGGWESVDGGTGQPIEFFYRDIYKLEVGISGFAFGVACNYPLPKLPIVLTGNVVYMPNMRFEGDWWYVAEVTADGVTEEEDRSHGSASYHQDGYAVELGVAYTFRENIGLSVGYKYQEVKHDDNVGEYYGSQDMEFSGVTFGVDYRF